MPIDIHQLLDYFPTVELPVSLTDDDVAIFSRNNDPLPSEVIGKVFSQWEKIEDEFVEFVPCFKVDDREHFYAIIYWKGGLLAYEYILTTFDKQGNLVARKVIASTHAEGDIVRKSVARIDEELIITIMAGESVSEQDYDPANSQAFAMEVMPTGEIEFMLSE